MADNGDQPQADGIRETVVLPALRVAGAYLVLGVLWILLSDRAVNWMLNDPDLLTWVQTWKGLGFVVASAGVIYLLVHGSLRRNHRISRDLRAQQAQLAHANRATLAGELSGSLVHELAQPLDAITLYAETCLERVEPTDRLHAPMTAVVEQAHRARAIIERLRRFMRKHEPSMESVNLSRLIDETRLMVQPDLQRLRVVVRHLGDEGVGRVRGDRVQIQQVLVNLILNAAEAMAESQPDQRNTVDIYLADETDHCLVTVADNGPGVAEEARAGLFEPFATSKANGLGLGLAISRSIVRAHGGELWYESRPSGGAAFLFTLPKGAL